MPVRSAPTRLKRLLDALRPGPVLILMHDNPDPDCFASASGLQVLLDRTSGVRSTLAYGGLIGRASNKTLLKALNLEVRHVDQVDFGRFPKIVLVDCQPRGGNNALPEDRIADAVIDHHSLRKATRAVPHADVRTGYGATCTMIVEYLNDAEIEIPQDLATLIFFAIRTETQELGREASKADVDAYMELFPLADLELVSSIERAKIPRDFFETWHRALRTTRLHGSAAVCPIGAVANPDMIPEVADMLLRLEDITWSMACGYHSGRVIFSLRTSEGGVNAGALALRVAGKRGTAGGHDMMAGGRTKVEAGERPGTIEADLIARFLRIIDNHAIPRPLILENRDR